MHFRAKFSLVLRCIQSIREGGAASSHPTPIGSATGHKHAGLSLRPKCEQYNALEICLEVS